MCFWELCGPLLLKTWIPFHTEMLSFKFGKNRCSSSRDDNFEILSMCFCYFAIIYPLEKRTGMTLQLKKIDFPSPKDALIVPSLVEIGLEVF